MAGVVRVWAVKVTASRHKPGRSPARPQKLSLVADNFVPYVQCHKTGRNFPSHSAQEIFVIWVKTFSRQLKLDCFETQATRVSLLPTRLPLGIIHVLIRWLRTGGHNPYLIPRLRILKYDSGYVARHDQDVCQSTPWWWKQYLPLKHR